MWTFKTIKHNRIILLKKEFDQILGTPSGDVIFLTPEETKKLRDLKLIKHEDFYIYQNIQGKNVYIFKDANYKEIRKILGK